MYRKIVDTIGWAVGVLVEQQHGEGDGSETNGSSPSHNGSTAPIPIDAHFVFLVHGFMGNDKELSFLEEAINEAVSKLATSKDSSGDSDAINEAASKKAQDDTAGTALEVVVHRVKCNNTSTFDGIEAGGKRLASEVKDFVLAYANERRQNGTLPVDDTDFHATISFFGYSLGGLYSRYAISVLPFEFKISPDLDSSNAKVILHANTFCTAATPHLGVAAHTYFVLPRCTEYIFAIIFGRTGRDLFRTNRGRWCCYSCSSKKQSADEEDTEGERNYRNGPNDLIYKMATQEAFLAPLSAFQQRTSYINAFGTDMQVPTATAGMLSYQSNSPHHLSEESSKWSIEDIDALVFVTEQGKPPADLQKSGTVSLKDDEALTMSLSLDSLGWKKVFVDCRKVMHCSKARIPLVCRRPRKEVIDSLIDKRRKPLAQNSDGKRVGVVFESKELCNLMRKSEQMHLLPTGHFAIVAHSKTESGAKMSAKGRPFVRQAAVDLVNDMKRYEILS